MNRNLKIIAYSFITLLFLFTALLIIILISYLIYSAFEDWETIIAGCIGFIGAVLGGAITLFGVNKTLKEQRRKDDIRTLELKYFAIQEYILEIEDLKLGIGKLNVHIIANYKSVGYHNDRMLNDLVSQSVRQYSAKIQELRNNKEFIRKMEGVGFELYSRELSFLKDLNTEVLALIAVKDDLFASAKLYENAYENIGDVIEKLNEKYIELHILKQKVSKEIRDF